MRKNIDDEAIVIRDKPGKIIGGLLALLSTLAIAGILGGISMAFAQQSANAEMRTNIQNIQENSQERDRRLDKMDGKIESVQTSVNDLGKQQSSMNTKLDILLRNQGITPAR
jgi:peptidoglycan hydrolase CwlO-like protein